MRFPGILPAVTTPFDDRGDVDAAALHRTIRWLLDAGVHGIVATGTMGEAGSLSRDERRLVVETAVAAAEGRVPVVAGVSAGTPAAATGFASDAAAAGADAVMCLPPVGYRGDEREIEDHLRTVAEATGLPLMLYNNPEASGTDLPPDLVVALAERIEPIVAVKECSGDARRIPAILHAAEGRLEVLVGGDDWALEGFCAGATGWVSGVAVVAPEELPRPLRALPRRRPRARARGLPPPAAALALRHDPEARAVLQGRPRRGRPGRRPVPGAAARADAGRARRPRRRHGGPARAGPGVSPR